ncbi:hypothetical protein AVEN_78141-1 [Araneus ventricosus]|uniref:Uncharacterized protein n=1 Tax=Araneus ventricosus TaxID=182803 RepID=A0A4Y2RXP6_ARAVE|nr:hypothetical protein AVEN_46540-1 [Araneus ventricosus]GBN79774.1 hypothetical protein AVEN_78141-1 [Araneus ventricosus]
MDLINLNRGQMTRATPSGHPTLQTSAPHQLEDIRPTAAELTYTRPTFTMDLLCNHLIPNSKLHPQATEVWNANIISLPSVRKKTLISSCVCFYLTCLIS